MALDSHLGRKRSIRPHPYGFAAEAMKNCGEASMKHTSLLAFVLFACGLSAGQTNKVSTIIYDEWWAIKYAADACATSEFDDACKYHKYRDRELEYTFREKLSGAFKSNPVCSGVRLVVYDRGPQRFSDAVGEDQIKQISKNPHWFLVVKYVPLSKEQSWTMAFHPKPFSSTNPTSGEGDVEGIAYSVCSIANQGADRGTMSLRPLVGQPQ